MIVIGEKNAGLRCFLTADEVFDKWTKDTDQGNQCKIF